MGSVVNRVTSYVTSKDFRNYLLSTHFWGPVSNFGIPLAAVMDIKKDPEIISGKMTAALIGYSAVFMRYSLAVTPKNYLLFACHCINETSQLVQGARFLNYWNFGGREKKLKENPVELAKTAVRDTAQAVEQAVKPESK